MWVIFIFPLPMMNRTAGPFTIWPPSDTLNSVRGHQSHVTSLDEWHTLLIGSD
jgi:hypothetical protein